MLINTNAFVNIPVAILIFDNDGYITYRAYSPREYQYQQTNNGVDYRLEQFMSSLYNHIAYIDVQPQNNVTLHGKLKEVHTRYIQIPIPNRGTICFFTTYEHPHTNYKPVHRESPVFFDSLQASNYSNVNPNLIHLSCPHEFI
jgi:hypothetical protein